MIRPLSEPGRAPVLEGDGPEEVALTLSNRAFTMTLDCWGHVRSLRLVNHGMVIRPGRLRWYFAPASGQGRRSATPSLTGKAWRLWPGMLQASLLLEPGDVSLEVEAGADREAPLVWLRWRLHGPQASGAAHERQDADCPALVVRIAPRRDEELARAVVLRMFGPARYVPEAMEAVRRHAEEAAAALRTQAVAVQAGARSWLLDGVWLHASLECSGLQVADRGEGDGARWTCLPGSPSSGGMEAALALWVEKAVPTVRQALLARASTAPPKPLPARPGPPSFESGDALLDTLFAFSLDAAVSNFKADPLGGFEGLTAGVHYETPARTYFRDGYWTSQALLPFHPDLVRAQVVALAGGVHDDGSCPSAVLFPNPVLAAALEAAHRFVPGFSALHRPPRDFWSGHHDSPSFFLLLLYDYLAWTGDGAVLWEPVPGSPREAGSRHTVLGSAVRAARYLLEADVHDEGLARKPYDTLDWADNVFRSGWVTYDEALRAAALGRAGAILARLARWGDPPREEGLEELATSSARLALARRLEEAHRRARLAINEKLWLADRGYYAEYVEPPAGGGTAPSVPEPHLAIDTLTVLLWDLAPVDRARRVLDQTEILLESRRNHRQPCGDWGVMCCFPPYRDRRRLTGKTRFPYRYHNGAEWPYWSAVLALLRMRYGTGDWRYPLVRCWEVGLANGRAAPVEYHSPPYAPGSPNQAWSSMPAAAMVRGGFGIEPDLDGRFTVRRPPWGPSRLKGVRIHGQRYDFDL
ncbi:hypothetical protein U7230_00895 [Carboxydochorda subterranea]|uniref:Glycogen debranching enzyme n=1 Tax=Carboxydichorda subterranea TaxID=3109565 RepID=A0ABZ1BXS3_9FIRM|nr:hypothetical protein [Limnochorda sp. L945t]WRP17606.1 hypothetical protein U7230_00895 [Limnochorda sp. L945t]